MTGDGVVRCRICSHRAGPFEEHHPAGCGNALIAVNADEVVLVHRRCHQMIHSLIDRDPVLSGLVSPRAASAMAIVRLRSHLIRTMLEWIPE